MNKKLHINSYHIDKQLGVNMIAIFCLLLFVYASSIKLIQHEQFERQLSQMPMFSRTAALVAWALPMVELSLCGLLAFNMTRLVGLVGSLLLLTIFSLYLLIILNFAEQLPYAGDIVFAALGWKQHLAINLALTALVYVGINLRMTSDYYKY